MKAAVKYVLNTAAANGDCYLPKERLIAQAVDLLQLHPLAIENAIRDLQVNSQLLQEKLNGEDCVYLNYYFYAEMSVAKRLLELSADYDAPNMEYVATEIARVEKETGVVLAEEQTSGRGRLGRSFQSPRGCGLYLTALLRPQLPPIEVVDFTAWVAVAVCDGIQAACGVRPRIKWTNDIVLEGKKLCGILTEMGLENEINALQYLVTGIGVNVNQRPEDFSPDVRPIAASLFNVLGRPVRRSELAVQIIRALDRMYSAFPQGKADYLARYRADCLTPGNRVQLITPASRTEATALSIDDEFRLVVEYDDGRREALSAGEVSVRGMYGYV